MLEVLRQIRPKIRWRLLVLAGIAGLLLYIEDYRPDAIGLAAAPYRFGAVAWELGNLPDKWLHRTWSGPKRLISAQSREQRLADAEEFFALGARRRKIDREIIQLAAQTPATAHATGGAAALRAEQARLRERQSRLRLPVEETVEGAVADVLVSLGFQAWTGVFPPVDTVLTRFPDGAGYVAARPHRSRGRRDIADGADQRSTTAD